MNRKFLNQLEKKEPSKITGILMEREDAFLYTYDCHSRVGGNPQNSCFITTSYVGSPPRGEALLRG